MSIEETLKTLLGPLAGGRAYPDVTPAKPVSPLFVFQQVGGDAVNYVEATMPDKDHARMQVWVWAKTRIEAKTLERQARSALVTGLKATVYGAPVSIHDEALGLYGCRTDYGLWYTP